MHPVCWIGPHAVVAVLTAHDKTRRSRFARGLLGHHLGNPPKVPIMVQDHSRTDESCPSTLCRGCHISSNDPNRESVASIVRDGARPDDSEWGRLPSVPTPSYAWRMKSVHRPFNGGRWDAAQWCPHGITVFGKAASAGGVTPTPRACLASRGWSLGSGYSALTRLHGTVYLALSIASCAVREGAFRCAAHHGWTRSKG